VTVFGCYLFADTLAVFEVVEVDGLAFLASEVGGLTIDEDIGPKVFGVTFVGVATHGVVVDGDYATLGIQLVLKAIGHVVGVGRLGVAACEGAINRKFYCKCRSHSMMN
jgi:hypothetical protein